MARLRHFVPSFTLLNIYRSLIQPHTSYVLAVWGQAAQSNLNKIFILQKRALRLTNFAPFKSHAVPLFEFYNVLPLNFLYIKSICIIMRDVFNNKAPRNISSLFTLASDAHHYNTRCSQAGTFATQNLRTQQRIKSFSCIALVLRRGIVFLLIFVHYQNINLRRQYIDNCYIFYCLRMIMVTRLLLPLDLNSFEVYEISHFV